MDLTTIIIVLVILTVLGGATGVLAGEILYVIIAVAIILFVLRILGVGV